MKKLTMPPRHFNIGTIVTLISHPLFSNHTIDIFTNQVPPLMLVKDVFFEDTKKKLFSDEIEDAQISDNIKYTCVYFNNNKSEFIEVTVYHSFIRSYEFLKFDRSLDSDGKETKSEVSLIEEVKDYQSSDYLYGKIVHFKTNKLEQRKKFKAVQDNFLKISFTSPDFILSGIKKENLKDLFYPDGKPKRKASETFYKIIWYNHFQQKFSEQYLPCEFFVDQFPNQFVNNESSQRITEIINPSKTISDIKDFESGSTN